MLMWVNQTKLAFPKESAVPWPRWRHLPTFEATSTQEPLQKWKVKQRFACANQDASRLGRDRSNAIHSDTLPVAY